MDNGRPFHRIGRLSLAVGLVASLAALLSLLAAFSVGAVGPAEPVAAAETARATAPAQQGVPPFWARLPIAARATRADDGPEPFVFVIPGLRLRVNQDHDWVDGRTSPNATIWITATDSLGAIKGTNQTTARGDGHFDGVNLQDGGGQQVDLAPGDTVIASSSDGSAANVTIVAMTGAVDASANIISGQIVGGVFPALVRSEVWVEDGPIVYGTVDWPVRGLRSGRWGAGRGHAAHQ